MGNKDAGKQYQLAMDYSVTMRSDRVISDMQHSAESEEDDSSAIYKMLRENLKPVDFSYYLKRYVYRKVGYKADFESVPLQNYIETITEAFSNKGMPVSLYPTSTRLRAAVKNWLTQKTVSREAVIMLGFGLEMNLQDVDELLTKALQESSLNPKDPVETICWYCLKNRLGYYHFRQLLSRYEALPGTASDQRNLSHTGTMVLRTEVAEITNEKSLLMYLNQLRRIDGKSRQSVDARILFDRLYEEACGVIADLNNKIEEEKNEIEMIRLREKLSRNDRLFDEQKQAQIQNLANRRKQWSKEEITPVQFEEVLFSAIPRDLNGNLIPMKVSTLNEQFRGKRLSRQHIQDILDGKGTINRYDLATMSFFVLSHRFADEEDQMKRYYAFLNYTNVILDRCGMGELYAANPYEAFLMICMLSDYPLGTYADVWELSYNAEKQEG